MSQLDGKVSLIEEANQNREKAKSTAPEYNVLAIHGLGDVGHEDAFWACTQEKGATSWLTDLLPVHAHCTRIMTFDYSLKNVHEGVSIQAVRDLATRLLDQLLEMYDRNAYITFLAHDLGGLIAKEALSMAAQSNKYHVISGMTSMLVFFSTPHRVTDSRSWESIASWLLRVSGEDACYSVRGITKTAHMLETANEGFECMENIYSVVNVYYQQISPSEAAGAIMWQALDPDSATLGTRNEINIGRDETHADITKFPDERDEAFVTIYQQLRASKGPGIQYFECLKFLSDLAGHDLLAKQVLSSRESWDMECEALQQFKDNDTYRSWRQSITGILNVQGRIGLDTPRLLSLVTSSDDTIVVRFRCDSRSSPQYGSDRMFASLCFQVLCLRPHLFDHVSDLYKLFSEGTRWRPRLRVFFISLMGCPFDGPTVCLIQDIDEMRNAKKLLKCIGSMTNDAVKNLKFIVTAGSNIELSDVLGPTAVVHINPSRPNLKDIVRSEVNSMLSKRPSLSIERVTLVEMLHGKLADNIELSALSEPSIASIINILLMLFVDGADPATRYSLKYSCLLMATKTDDIYRDLVSRIIPRRRQNVRNALSWMARAIRPLKLDELAIATVFEHQRKSINGIEDETPIDLAWDLNVNFGNLVQVDSRQIVHMSESFRNHLLRQKPEGGNRWIFPLDSDGSLALKCLSYISLLLQQGPVELPTSQDARSQLLSYSVLYWPYHYNKNTPRLDFNSEAELGQSRIFPFFNDYELMRKWAQLYFDSGLPDMRCQSNHPLVVSVEVECSDLVRILLKSRAHDADILTAALEAAIAKGHQDLIRILQSFGAVSNIALHIIATSEKLNLLQMFHKTDADLKAENSQGLTPLHCACRSGYLAAVEELLRIGSNPDAKSSMTGQTPLHVACQFGHLDTIVRLLESDADANEEDKSGFTPLHVACKWQQIESIRLLLDNVMTEQSQDVDVRSRSLAMALRIAAGSGRVDIVRFLLDKHRDLRTVTDTDNIKYKLLGTQDADGSTPLHLAAASGHPEVVRELLRSETAEDPVPILIRDEQGCIPLHLAVEGGCSDVVKQLLEREDTVVESQIMSRASSKSRALPIHLAVAGGHFTVAELLCKAHQKLELPLDLFHSRSLSPLHVAASKGHVDIVKLLLNNNAEVNILDWDNATPLHFASQVGNVHIVKLLLEKGADPDTETDERITPVLEAAEKGFTNVVELLLRNEINRDVNSNIRSSVLMVAARRGHTNLVRMLLRERPNLEARNESDFTPLMLATRNGHVEIIKLLLENDADPNTGNSKGRKAIHFAAECADLTAIQLFLDCPNVEANETDSIGRTPLHLAVEAESLDVIKALLQKGADTTAEDTKGTSPLSLVASEELMEILLASTNIDEIVSSNRIFDDVLRRAAEKGYLRVIKEQHKHNANLKTLDESGRSLYHLAAETGNAEVIKLLYELNIPGFDEVDNTKRTPASYASEKGHLEAMKLLAEMAPESLRHPDDRERTPLSYAAACKEFDVVEYLLGSTYAVRDVNKADASDRTPLWNAANGGSVLIVQALLRHQADPNIADKDFALTPLHHAASKGDQEMLNLLLDSKSLMNVQDHKKRTPLYQAAWSDCAEVVSMLLDRGALDIPDDSGWRALHAAYDSPQVLKLLLAKSDADVNSTTEEGMTALHLAVNAGYNESAEVLLCSGADPLKPDQTRVTPLHLAATRNVNDEVFSLLLQNAKTPLDAKDDRDRTPLMAAIEESNRPAVEALLNTGQFVLGEIGKGENSALDVALQTDSSDMMDLILSHGGADISTESVEKILVWALKEQLQDIKERTIQILNDRKVKVLSETRTLFGLATKKDDIQIAKFLFSLGSDPEMRDEHGWTLSQIVAAFDPPVDIQLSLDNEHRLPSRWSAAHSSHNAAVSDVNGLQLRCSDEPSSRYAGIVSARSDHPIPLRRRFYFEINVIKVSEQNVLGIGFSHSDSSKERMPGWDDNSWGLHGDDGAMFHASGSGRSSSSDWKYGPDDCIGCCIDFVQRKAFFTRNGIVIDACFKGLYGRIFPMVGFEEGSEVVANFGGDLTSSPFRYPDGLTREYCVSEDIE